MAGLEPGIAADVVAACQANVAEIAAGLSRTFDLPLELTIGPNGTVDPLAWPAGFEGAGLVVLLTVEQSAAVVVLPEASGLLPAWYSSPDPTGQSKLTTLAQELGMQVLPDALLASDFNAARVNSLITALGRGRMASTAACLRLMLTSADGRSGDATLIWPLENPAGVFDESLSAIPGAAAAVSAPAVEPTIAPPATTAQAAAATPAKPLPKLPRPRGVQDLPSYSRSLLRIKVPVTVTLAAKKQPIGSILELGMGSIIHFDKSCEETLELEVNGHPIAEGEAVKVGEKFGLRITSLILPEEQFKPVQPR